MGNEAPKLVSRRDNKKSTFRMGRTIGEKREKLETANERATARKKDKRRKATRVLMTLVAFLVLAGAVVILSLMFFGNEKTQTADTHETTLYEPTVEIVDEAGGEGISARMRAWIGQAEQDFRDLGYTPVRVVVPAEAIREVDFYLEGYTGFIKLIIDRGTAVSVEDADRMIRYLASNGTGDFTYIDVRVEGKGYWK